MELNILIIAVFCLIPGIIFYAYRNSTLSKLPPLPGESTILDESPVPVYETGLARPRCYNNCIIRLTDSRIIIAQKLPLRKDSFFLRFVINYRAAEIPVSMAHTLRKGYYSVDMPAARISLKEEGSGLSVGVPIPAPKERRIEFKINRAGDFNAALTKAL